MMQWLMIVALGVDRALLYWGLEQVAIAASAAMRASAKKSAEQRKITNEQAQRRQIESNQKQAALRQLKATCDFWPEQLAKEKASQNRLYRDETCNLVNNFR